MLGEWNGDGKVGQGLAHARPRFAKVYTTLLVTREAVEDVTNISLLFWAPDIMLEKPLPQLGVFESV